MAIMTIVCALVVFGVLGLAFAELPSVVVHRSGALTGKPTRLSFPDQKALHAAKQGTVASAADTYLHDHLFEDFGVSVFGLGEAAEMKLKDSVALPGDAGLKVHQYEQRVRGLRTVASSVNILEGAHGGVLSARGAPLRHQDLSHISAEASVTVEDALLTSVLYLEQEYGLVHRMDVMESPELVWVRSADMYENNVARTAHLAHAFTLKTHIDMDIYGDCFAPEDGIGSDRVKLVRRSPSAGPKTPDEEAASKVLNDACLARVHPKQLSATSIRESFTAHDFSDAHQVQSIDFAHKMGLRDRMIRGSKVRKVPIRIVMYVDAHSRAVIHYENKDGSMLESMFGERSIARKKRVESRKLMADKSRDAERRSLATSYAAENIDFDDFHVKIYDCEGDDASCDPEVFTTVLWDSSTNAWPTGDETMNMLVSTTWATRSLYQSMSNGAWNSFKGAENPVWKIYINLSIVNAFWDGSRTVFGLGITQDDVVSHEWSHAYTEYTSSLAYFFQSGALNEHMSDVFGESVDQLNTLAGYQFDGDYDNDDLQGGQASYDGMDRRSDDLACNTFNDLYETDDQEIDDDAVELPAVDPGQRWMIGEGDILVKSGVMTAFRDMWFPWCFSDPMAVPMSNEEDDLYFMSCGDSDNGGVHTNSNIPNYLFAHLVDGGRVYYNPERVGYKDDPSRVDDNDFSEYYDIEGWGMAKAATFWWMMNSDMMKSQEATMFVDFAEDLLSLCSVLEGTSIPAASVNQTISSVVITAGDCLSLEMMINATRMDSDPSTYCVEDISPLESKDAVLLCELVDHYEDNAWATTNKDASHGLSGWTCNDANVPDPDPCVHPGLWSGIATCLRYGGKTYVRSILMDDVDWANDFPVDFSWEFTLDTVFARFSNVNVTGTPGGNIYNMNSFVFSHNPMLTGPVPSGPDLVDDYCRGLLYAGLSDNSFTAMPQNAITVCANYDIARACENNIESCPLFDMSNNLIAGPITDEFASSTAIGMLDVSNNLLDQDLTKLLTMSLYGLDASNNSFSGDIESATLHDKLMYLDLSYNNLTGAIPSSWCCGDLNHLDISGNPYITEYPGCLTALPDGITASDYQACSGKCDGTDDKDHCKSSKGSDDDDDEKLDTGTVVGAVLGGLAACGGAMFAYTYFIKTSKVPTAQGLDRGRDATKSVEMKGASTDNPMHP